MQHSAARLGLSARQHASAARRAGVGGWWYATAWARFCQHSRGSAAPLALLDGFARQRGRPPVLAHRARPARRGATARRGPGRRVATAGASSMQRPARHPCNARHPVPHQCPEGGQGSRGAAPLPRTALCCPLSNRTQSRGASWEQLRANESDLDWRAATGHVSRRRRWRCAHDHPQAVETLPQHMVLPTMVLPTSSALSTKGANMPSNTHPCVHLCITLWVSGQATCRQ